MNRIVKFRVNSKRTGRVSPHHGGGASSGSRPSSRPAKAHGSRLWPRWRELLVVVEPFSPSRAPSAQDPRFQERHRSASQPRPLQIQHPVSSSYFTGETQIVFIEGDGGYAHLFDAPLLKKELESLGLPVLYLEWEHSMTGTAQLKTRVEAFIEMISGVS